MGERSIKRNHLSQKGELTSLNQRSRFIELSMHLAQLVEAEGLTIRPFDSPTLPYFSAATFGQRETALKMLNLMVELTEEVQKKGERARDAASLIWAFCRTWKFIPTWDFHDKIENGDMVDVYNLQGQLIFANLRFYEIITYTLEQLYFCQWHTLFNHEEEFQKKLQSVCAEIPKNPHQLYDLRHLGQHRVKENFGKMEGIFQPTYFSSLVHNGKVAGFICINRVVEIISQ